jgi:ribosome-associated protein
MTPLQTTDILQLSQGVCIPLTELRFSFGRSPGPGGQHVNKVNTRVELRFDLGASRSLSDDLRQRARARLGGRLNRAGELVVASSRHRSQIRNRAECVERFALLMEQALQPPAAKRRRTKPGRAAIARRQEANKRHAQKKSLRRRPGLD